MKKISRRDFIKISSALSASLAVSSILPKMGGTLLGRNENKPNIFVFVFDAMSARDLSVYGYPRPTTPFLEQLAGRSTVYHSHHAGGSFTTPGTSTLLTGLYPWRHRAFTVGGIVDREIADQNIFQLMGADYYRVGYAQNVWADLLLRQFRSGLDHHIPVTSYLYKMENPLIGQRFMNDPIMGYYAFDVFLSSSRHSLNPRPGSLTMGITDMVNYSLNGQRAGPSDEYPNGLPSNGYFSYHNDTVFDGLLKEIGNALAHEMPMFGYFHTFSPHSPYAPRKDFVHKLPNIGAPVKPRHPLSTGHIQQKKLNQYRIQYDQYISNVDMEFGRLMNSLNSAGALENSYVIITSDHGEVFERGEAGHASPLLYEPVTNIPLLISAPGQTARRDIHALTSNVDILPTVLHIAGREIPPGLDGRILPGIDGDEDWDRTIFMVDAKESSTFLPLTQASIGMIKGGQKMIYYLGYPKYSDIFELFDLQDDKEEMKNIYLADESGSAQMRDELLGSLSTANQLYVKKRK